MDAVKTPWLYTTDKLANAVLDAGTEVARPIRHLRDLRRRRQEQTALDGFQQCEQPAHTEEYRAAHQQLLQILRRRLRSEDSRLNIARQEKDQERLNDPAFKFIGNALRALILSDNLDADQLPSRPVRYDDKTLSRTIRSDVAVDALTHTFPMGDDPAELWQQTSTEEAHMLEYLIREVGDPESLTVHNLQSNLRESCAPIEHLVATAVQHPDFAGTFQPGTTAEAVLDRTIQFLHLARNPNSREQIARLCVIHNYEAATRLCQHGNRAPEILNILSETIQERTNGERILLAPEIAQAFPRALEILYQRPDLIAARLAQFSTEPDLQAGEILLAIDVDFLAKGEGRQERHVFRSVRNIQRALQSDESDNLYIEALGKSLAQQPELLTFVLNVLATRIELLNAPDSFIRTLYEDYDTGFDHLGDTSLKSFLQDFNDPYHHIHGAAAKAQERSQGTLQAETLRETLLCEQLAIHLIRQMCEDNDPQNRQLLDRLPDFIVREVLKRARELKDLRDQTQDGDPFYSLIRQHGLEYDLLEARRAE